MCLKCVLEIRTGLKTCLSRLIIFYGVPSMLENCHATDRAILSRENKKERKRNILRYTETVVKGEEEEEGEYFSFETLFSREV